MKYLYLIPIMLVSLMFSFAVYAQTADQKNNDDRVADDTSSVMITPIVETSPVVLGTPETDDNTMVTVMFPVAQNQATPWSLWYATGGNENFQGTPTEKELIQTFYLDVARINLVDLHRVNSSQAGADYYIANVMMDDVEPLLDDGWEYMVPSTISSSEAQTIAKDWIMNAPTYKFDGSDLSLAESFPDFNSPDTYYLIYTFKSADSGYGDRSGEIYANEVTWHSITVSVTGGNVTSALMDGRWDELNQQPYVVDYTI